MRISLLQQREPFGQILERTLSRFLSGRFGSPFSVCWHSEPGYLGRSQKGQAWYINIYLNAIFPAQAKTDLFEPLRREFSRSRVGWLRPIQQAYVLAASSPPSNRVLAQAWLEITPTIPGAENWLIVPGNHKIRILNRQAETATSILKDGFDTGFFGSELAARQSAEAAGAAVPPLRRVCEADGWFEEQYVVGTPLNRLADASRASQALRSAHSALQPFYQASHTQVPLAVYVHKLTTGAQVWIEQNRLLDDLHRQELRKILRDCAQRLEPWNQDAISLTLCHGDFQPANLLADGANTWLIDWEYARRCQAGYDALVYGLGARHPRGLAGCVRDFITGRPNPSLLQEGAGQYATNWATRSLRARAACVFLLEELSLHLHENCNPQFIRLGQGLTALEHEILEWLSMEEGKID